MYFNLRKKLSCTYFIVLQKDLKNSSWRGGKLLFSKKPTMIWVLLGGFFWVGFFGLGFLCQPWYIGYMNRSSFWKFWPNFFRGKCSKVLEEYFLHFCNLKKCAIQHLVYIYAKFQLIRCRNRKKLLASQKRDRFPVRPCHVVNLSRVTRVPYALKWNFLHFVQS